MVRCLRFRCTFEAGQSDQWEHTACRCHRIGQIIPVDVFKFEMQDFDTYQDVTSITLEKYVNFVQDMKRNISTQILNEVPDT